MGKIRQLDEVLSNKIAAGEVVERPSSVVKELTENSIDASASRISIFIEDGGLQKIKVVDNGDGMELEDAKLCFSRHATSKIKDDHDLFNIMTLGFRGEAIPSIASISHFDLRTSTGEQGVFVEYEFGKYKNEGVCDLPKGTQITVSKLFQNVPARLKYLKSVNSEFAAIHQYVERIALAHPHIAISLHHNNKMIFQTNGKGQLLEVIAGMYGIVTAKNMIPLQASNDEFEIHGYISKIDTSRASKNNIITLVNHRFVKNLMSIDAINSVYRAYLADNRYPIAVINIDVDPYLVDVNVHPSKLEVRFSKEYELRELIQEAVEQTLKSIDLKYQVKNKITEREKFVPQLDQITFDLKEPEPVSIPKTTYSSEKETVELKKREDTQPFIKENQETYQDHPIQQEVIQERPMKEKYMLRHKFMELILLARMKRACILLISMLHKKELIMNTIKINFRILI